MKSSQLTDPTSDARASLGCERYARVLNTFRSQAQEILIMRTEYPRQRRGSRKVIAVSHAELIQIPNRHRIDSQGSKLPTHLGGHILIEIEAKLTHPGTQRPWAAKRSRQSSACSSFSRISASISAL